MFRDRPRASSRAGVSLQYMITTPSRNVSFDRLSVSGQEFFVLWLLLFHILHALLDVIDDPLVWVAPYTFASPVCFLFVKQIAENLPVHSLTLPMPA